MFQNDPDKTVNLLRTEGVARLIVEEYSDRTTYGKEDHEEALQSAIDWACKGYSDEYRADLYTRIVKLIPTRDAAGVLLSIAETELKRA